MNYNFKLITLTLFLLFSIQNVRAQKCDVLERWTRVVSEEFPNIDYNKTNSKFRQRIIFNLFSDEYFIPYFKKPYDMVGDIMSQTMWKRFNKCDNETTITWQAESSFLNSTFFNYYKLKKTVIEGRKLIEEFTVMKKEILNGDISKIDVDNYLNQINKKFNILFPSKIEPLIKILETEIEKRKVNSINQNYDNLLNELNDVFKLAELENFKSKNASLVSKLNSTQKNNLHQLIWDRQSLLANREIEPIYQSQKNKKYSEYSDLKIIDAESSKFFKTYIDYGLGIEFFEKTITLFKKQHLELLILNENEILKRINKSRTKEQFEYIKSEYLEFEHKAKYIYYDHFDDTLDKRRCLEFEERLLKEISKRKKELGIRE
ncbi:hypothetical protein SAMN05428642_1113 [Flaviramulus basaltis]|uniref:Uncharacterized protein n=1 Tax=Flaviramulus basaltis TaxID=369401 RepID=A0A1K2ISF6_9FLAO|nr:hypothetical protein [Flaviramulus basaltis]SFZ95186.1 hypothetical protein SAMN05428642_1113 [Flaviramulus basaltis]